MVTGFTGQRQSPSAAWKARKFNAKNKLRKWVMTLGCWRSHAPAMRPRSQLWNVKYSKISYGSSRLNWNSHAGWRVRLFPAGMCQTAGEPRLPASLSTALSFPHLCPTWRSRPRGETGSVVWGLKSSRQLYFRSRLRSNHGNFCQNRPNIALSVEKRRVRNVVFSRTYNFLSLFSLDSS